MTLDTRTGIITRRGKRPINQDSVFHYTELFELEYLDKYTELNGDLHLVKRKIYEGLKRFRSHKWLMGEEAVQNFKAKFPIIYQFLDEVIETVAAEHGDTLSNEAAKTAVIDGLAALKGKLLDLPLYVNLYGIQRKSFIIAGKSEAENAYKTFQTEYGHEVFEPLFEQLDKEYRELEPQIKLEKTRQKRFNDAIRTRGRLFAVADGIAGAQEGHIASRFATVSLRKYYEAKEHLTSGLSCGVILQRVIEEIDKEIKQFSIPTGTTLTAVLIEEDQLWVCWVGDTAAYLIQRDGSVELLTPGLEKLSSDEATQPLTSYLGQGLLGGIHLEGPKALQAGDRILIASDGVSRYLSSEQIGEVVHNPQKSPQEAAQRLVELAMEASDDNMTALVINVSGEALEQVPQLKKRKEV
jgi:protein phosphatase